MITPRSGVIKRYMASTDLKGTEAPVAFVLGLEENGYGIVRSLARAGIVTIGYWGFPRGHEQAFAWVVGQESDDKPGWAPPMEGARAENGNPGFNGVPRSSLGCQPDWSPSSRRCSGAQ